MDEAVVKPVAMVAMTIGPEVARNFNNRPGTTPKAIAMMRAEFLKAQDYMRRQQQARDGNGPSRDLKLEVLAQVLRGEIPARSLPSARRTSAPSLRLQPGIRLQAYPGGAAESYDLINEIKAAGVPVIIDPTMARHSGTLENASMETIRRLRDAGIQVALQSGYEGYVPKTRVVLFEAAMAAAYGMPFEQALAAITIDAAAHPRDRRPRRVPGAREGRRRRRLRRRPVRTHVSRLHRHHRGAGRERDV